jgi:hypothetical protein
MRRTDDNPTAKAAAGIDTPALIAPMSTTFAGRAQMVSVINTACPAVMPLSIASPEKPIKELISKMAGTLTIRRVPRKNQPRWPDCSADCWSELGERLEDMLQTKAFPAKVRSGFSAANAVNKKGPSCEGPL